MSFLCICQVWNASRPEGFERQEYHVFVAPRKAEDQGYDRPPNILFLCRTKPHSKMQNTICFIVYQSIMQDILKNLAMQSIWVSSPFISHELFSQLLYSQSIEPKYL
jgi:hypothetical protein